MASSRGYIQRFLVMLGMCMLNSMLVHGMTEVLDVERVDLDRIERNAAQYGYKAANLMELELVVEIINKRLERPCFAVPPFLEVSHDTTVAYLSEISYDTSNVYDYVIAQWAQFVDKQKEFGGRKLAPEACVHVSKMAKALRYACKEQSFGSGNKAYKKFLEGIKGKAIVRSTHIHEDTKNKLICRCL